MLGDRRSDHSRVMTTTPHAPVVVGVDGSEHQRLTLAWAVSEARLRNRPLTIVHSYDLATFGTSFDVPPYGAVQEAMHARAEEVRDAALAAAQEIAPDLDVRAEIRDGGAAAVLVAASRNAALVVVGRHGGGGLAGLLLGSVADAVARHAACPAVVVGPRSTPDGGRIVAGVDGSPHSAEVLDFAFQEASLRGLGLTAIHAWRWPVASAPGDMLPPVYDVDDTAAEANRLLAEAVAGWGAKYPDVALQTRTVRDRPGPALVKAAEQASLLVVGARGRGGFAGLRLGSASRTALHHANCPVAVVPAAT